MSNSFPHQNRKTNLQKRAVLPRCLCSLHLSWLYDWPISTVSTHFLPNTFFSTPQAVQIVVLSRTRLTEQICGWIIAYSPLLWVSLTAGLWPGLDSLLPVVVGLPGSLRISDRRLSPEVRSPQLPHPLWTVPQRAYLPLLYKEKSNILYFPVYASSKW